MAAIAAIVFIALYFVEAGYGMLFDKKWGLPIPNKIAWIAWKRRFLSSCFCYGTDRNDSSRQYRS